MDSNDFKYLATKTRNILKNFNHDVPLGQCYELLSQLSTAKTWNVTRSTLSDSICIPSKDQVSIFISYIEKSFEEQDNLSRIEEDLFKIAIRQLSVYELCKYILHDKASRKKLTNQLYMNICMRNVVTKIDRQIILANNVVGRVLDELVLTNYNKSLFDLISQAYGEAIEDVMDYEDNAETQDEYIYNFPMLIYYCRQKDELDEAVTRIYGTKHHISSTLEQMNVEVEEK